MCVCVCVCASSIPGSMVIDSRLERDLRDLRDLREGTGIHDANSIFTCHLRSSNDAARVNRHGMAASQIDINAHQNIITSAIRLRHFHGTGCAVQQFRNLADWIGFERANKKQSDEYGNVRPLLANIKQKLEQI